MVGLKELALGADGRSYLESCLSQGQAGGLAERLLKSLPAEYDVFALVPENTALSRAKAFDTGGLMRWSDASAWLSARLSSLGGAVAECAFVVQDVWMSPTDRTAQKTEEKKFFQGGNVYYFLEKHELDAAAVRRVLNAPSSFRLVAAFVATGVPAAAIAADFSVSEVFVERLVSSTREVYCSAYDREGLIVWRR